jgi:hypothetical protein
MDDHAVALSEEEGATAEPMSPMPQTITMVTPGV